MATCLVPRQAIRRAGDVQALLGAAWRAAQMTGPSEAAIEAVAYRLVQQRFAKKSDQQQSWDRYAAEWCADARKLLELAYRIDAFRWMSAITDSASMSAIDDTGGSSALEREG